MVRSASRRRHRLHSYATEGRSPTAGATTQGRRARRRARLPHRNRSVRCTTRPTHCGASSRGRRTGADYAYDVSANPSTLTEDEPMSAASVPAPSSSRFPASAHTPSGGASRPERAMHSIGIVEAARARILVADDDETLRSTCVHVLEQDGHEVVACGRGEESLDVAQHRAFDIAFVVLFLSRDVEGPVLRHVERLLAASAGDHLVPILF